MCVSLYMYVNVCMYVIMYGMAVGVGEYSLKGIGCDGKCGDEVWVTG